MDINELLDVVDYAIGRYKSKALGNRFSLLEYFSLTDIEPRDLTKIANNNKRRNLGNRISAFAENHYFGLCKVDMGKKLRNFHSIHGYELTPDDKLNIEMKLAEEKLPLIEEIYDLAARYYVDKGVDYISKEAIRNSVIESYNKARGITLEAAASPSHQVTLIKDFKRS